VAALGRWYSEYSHGPWRLWLPSGAGTLSTHTGRGGCGCPRGARRCNNAVRQVATLPRQVATLPRQVATLPLGPSGLSSGRARADMRSAAYRANTQHVSSPTIARAHRRAHTHSGAARLERACSSDDSDASSARTVGSSYHLSTPVCVCVRARACACVCVRDVRHESVGPPHHLSSSIIRTAPHPPAALSRMHASRPA
jgi:hypothetical protein